jgi:hypothetical protein
MAPQQEFGLPARDQYPFVHIFLVESDILDLLFFSSLKGFIVPAAYPVSRISFLLLYNKNVLHFFTTEMTRAFRICVSRWT